MCDDAYRYKSELTRTKSYKTSCFFDSVVLLYSRRWVCWVVLWLCKLICFLFQSIIPARFARCFLTLPVMLLGNKGVIG